MAILKIDFYSRSLRRTVTAEALIPAEAIRQGERCACLYLLHGVQGSHINWLASTNLYRLLGQYHSQHAEKLAVIMPSGGNSFYHPAPGRKEDYESFLGEELPELSRAMLPLKSSRGDTMIAGLSMGGYGALRTGLLYPQVFGFAAGLSSALLTQDMSGLCREDGSFFQKEAFLTEIFGGLEGLEESRHDVLTLGKELARGGCLPELYVACGRQDRLLPLSRQLHAGWQRAGVSHVYEEQEGDHDWGFWEWGLSRILELRGNRCGSK